MKNKVLRKALAVSLAAAMMFGTGFTAAGQFAGTGVSVSAAWLYGDFEYEENDDGTVTIVSYTGDGGKVTIPSKIDGYSVTAIGDGAFEYADITSVSIPNTVNYIGEDAFCDCEYLTSVTIPTNVTHIGGGAFDNTPWYNKKSNGLIYIGKVLYDYKGEMPENTSIVVPDNIVSISDFAFFGCYGLKTITIPSGVVDIGENTFSWCSVYIQGDSGSYAEMYAKENGIDFEVGYNDLMYDICDDGTVIIQGYLGDSKSISIPSKINGRSVTAILDWAFESTDITSVSIPSTIKHIGDCAFFDCKYLTSVTIPSGVSYIGTCAFCGCENLRSISIPGSVTYIGGSAFYDTAWYDKKSDGIIYINKVLYAYKGEIPENTVISVSSGTVSISNEAFFDGVENLKKITIPDSVTQIGDDTFRGVGIHFEICGSAGSYAEEYAAEHHFTFTCVYNNFTYRVKTDDTITITGYVGSSKSVSIPSTINGKTVTEIGSQAFFRYSDDDDKGITSVTIPNTVEYIGESAFAGTGLNTVTIPKSVISIGKKAFADCQSLTSVTISDGVQKMGSEVFAGDYRLQGNITIPASVTSLNRTFERSYFTNINVDSNNKNYSSIDGVLFNKDATILVEYPTYRDGTLYTVPNSVTSIGYAAFYSCSKLTSINIPEGVTSIGEDAFYYCSKLTSIDIPESVTSIGYRAFDGCSKLTIYCAKDSYAKKYAEHYGIKFISWNNSSVISADTIALGGKVTIYAKAESDEDGYTYAVLYKKKSDTNWTTKQNYSTNNIVTIKPAQAVEYDICVKVKDSSGTELKKYFTVKVTQPEELKNTSLLSADSINLGDSITITGAASGGTGSYKYNVLYKQTSQTSWTTAQSYSENAVVSFKPAKAVEYDVCVKVKDSNGTEVKKYFTVKVTQAVAELSNTSTLSATSVKLGDTVTVKCSATGGTGSYQYNVLYKQTSQSKWTTAQSYKANAAVSFKPGSAATYDVCVKVKDSNGTEVKKYFTVKVEKATNELNNISTISSTSIKLGETVTVTAKGSGSSGFYLYAVYSKKTSDTKWTTQQNFSSNGKIIFKPEQAVSYDICVKVKDDKDSIAKKYFTITVSSQSSLTNTSTISADTIKLGNEITVNCSAKGSTGFYQYAVYYKQTSQSKWTTKQNYDPNYTVSVKPNAATTYDICVKVKDNLGNETKKYFTVTVK